MYCRPGARALSRRADSLGTENAFVVLAEVNALARSGKDIVSFCIGQPDFPTPHNIQDAAIAAIREASTATRRRPASTSCVPLRHATWVRDAGSTIHADDVVVAAGAKPFIAYTIVSVTDYGVGDEVIYPVPGFPIYESQIIANGAVPVPIFLREARDYAFDPAELEAKITAKTRLLILNSPQNPTGGVLSARDLDAIAEILLHASAGLGIRRRDLLAAHLRRRVRFARAPRWHARAHRHLRRRVEDVGDDGLAPGLRRQSRARAGVHALDHEHRIVRIADLAMGRGGGDQRSAGLGGRHARAFPRAARSDRPRC